MTSPSEDTESNFVSDWDQIPEHERPAVFRAFEIELDRRHQIIGEQEAQIKKLRNLVAMYEGRTQS